VLRKYLRHKGCHLVKKTLIIVGIAGVLTAAVLLSSVLFLKWWFHRDPIFLYWDFSKSWDQDIAGWPKGETSNLWWIVDRGELHLKLAGHDQLLFPFVQLQVRRVGRQIASIFIYRGAKSFDEAQVLAKSTLAEWSLNGPKTLESLDVYLDYWRHPPAGRFDQSRDDWKVDGPGIEVELNKSPLQDQSFVFIVVVWRPDSNPKP
jgi:hypothetical protein